MYTRTICTLNVLSLALLAPLASAADSKSDPAAEKMLKAAHASRSSWDTTFPGFTASIKIGYDGKETTGTVTIRADGTVRVKASDEAAAAWAEGQLESIVMHRQAGVRDTYNVAFVEESGVHPLGKLIRFLDSKTKSVYRINGDVITEVHRDMGKTKFTISVTEVVRNAEGKYIPRAFNVSYWDGASGDLNRNEDYQEEWIRMGKFDLPKRRLLIKSEKGKRSVGELVLSDFQLLGTQAAK